MGLRWYYLDADEGTVEFTDRVRLASMELDTNAEEGSAGSSRIEVEDDAGDLLLGGLRKVWVVQDLIDTEEDDTAGVVWVGWTAERKITRDNKRTEQAAWWDAPVVDLNTVFEDRILLGEDCNRPAETDLARIAWLLGKSQVSGLFTGGDFVTTEGAVNMDPSDYRKQKARDVIDDCAQESGRNWFLYSVASGDPDDPTRFELFYDFDASEVWNSAVKITNELDDIDPEMLVFAPSLDAELEVSPSQVYTGVVVDYDGGWEYVERSDLPEGFRRRDTTMSAPNVKTKAAARRRGQRYLRDLATEVHVISVAIQVPPEQLNAIRAGQRMQVKFTHLGPWYREWTWLRTISRTTREITPEVYEIALELTTDDPVAGGSCPSPTPFGSYWPLGGSNPAKTANPSDGVIYYLRPGLFYPIEPTPGHVGTFHFAQFGMGGEGTTDYAGDCVQSRLRIIVVGDGTATIQTEVFSASRNLVVRLYHYDQLAFPQSVLDATYLGTSGDAFVVPVSSHGGTRCIHWIDVTDTHAVCGGKWGFSGMEWSE